MTYFSKVYKNGLINIPKVFREIFSDGYVSIEKQNDELVIKPVTSKPKLRVEDDKGIITEYENGDFDVEFKKGLTLTDFNKAISKLS